MKEEAFETFRALRWVERKESRSARAADAWRFISTKLGRFFKCKGCNAQFSVTTGTIFASRKMPLRDIPAAIAILVNGAKGHSALQLSRDLDCQYKTAFVLSHKIREALRESAEVTDRRGRSGRRIFRRSCETGKP